jgi:PAS domain S-box-containing protein
LTDNELFELLLDSLLVSSKSAYGFIGRIELSPDGKKQLRTNAITDISWDKASRMAFEQAVTSGMVFTNMDTLFGYVIRTGSMLIANDPANHPEKGGLPKGHPPLQSFCGIPFFYRGEAIGMVGLGNKAGGYSEALVADLSPLIHACSIIYEGIGQRVQREQHIRTQESLLQREHALNVELGASEMKFRSMIEHAYDGLVLYDAKGCVKYCSTSAERISGYKLSNHIGQSGAFFIHPDDREAAANHFRLILKNPGESIQFEQRILHAHGDVIWIEVNLTNMLHQPEVSAVVSNFRDITERKKSETQLQRSEQLYRSLFDLNPSPLWIYEEASFRFMAVNDAAVQRYGYSREEFLRMSIFDIRPPKEQKKLRRRIQENFSTVGVSANVVHTLSNGEEIHVDLYYNKIDYEGKPAYLVEVIDNTERYRNAKIAQEVLLELQNFRTAVDQGAMVALLDCNGRFLRVNKAIEEITGLKEAEFVGKSFYDLRSPFHRRSYYLQMLHAIRKGEYWRGEYKSVSPRGEIYWIDVILSPVVDRKGKTIQYIALCLPITERKKAEQERDLLIEDLIKKNQSLEEFAFITSHNLRAPVAQLLGLSSLFNRSNMEDPFNLEVLDNMMHASRNLDEVIRDLTEILAIKKDIKDTKEQIRFSEVLDTVEGHFKTQMDEQEIVFTKKLKGSDKLITVKSFLYSILLNLMSNAIKYRDPERQTEITVESTTEGPYFVFHFKDNGLGIDLKKQGSKVFGLYKRFHSHVEGRGLGLYLVKNQTEALGGTISIESEPGKGTTFKVTILRNLR